MACVANRKAYGRPFCAPQPGHHKLADADCRLWLVSLDNMREPRRPGRAHRTGFVSVGTSPAADSTTATDVKLTIKLSIFDLGGTRSVSTDIIGYQWVLPGS
jgi:hypothetical protein